jgi:ketosteroid isomerase-like protein
MTSNRERAAVLVRALRAGLDGDTATLEEVTTDDVRTWTPTQATSSRQELIDELGRRDRAFSDLELDATALDVSGDFACVEWSVSMTHVGPLTLGPDTVIEPTGTRVRVYGVTVAEFRDDRICSVRQYWDELTVVEQLSFDDR